MIKRLKRTSPETAEDYLAGDEDYPERQEPHPVQTATLLGRLLLDATLTPETKARFHDEQAIAVLVEPPTPAWVPHLRNAVCHAAAWDLVESRDGSTRHKRKPVDGVVELADAIASGRRTVVVCHAPEAHVPPSFIAATDLRLVTGRPTALLVAAAIKAMAGAAPTSVPEAVSTLDLHDIAAALRQGAGGPEACVRRLERAIAARSSSGTVLRDVPLVKDLRGYGGEALEWVTRLVEDWQSLEPHEFWRQADKSCVFFGDPGVGKTSLVHSLSKTLSLPLVETSVATWFDGSSYLDKTLSSMVEAFSNARSMGSGCVLFLDELDGMPSRDDPVDKNSSYWKPLQAAYLRELEATAAPGSRVILIGATNFPSKIDPAAVRPGRLGRLIRVRRPDPVALAGILRQHLGEDLAGVDLAAVAVAGAGATGAEAAAWVAGARRAARVAGRAITLSDLLDVVLPPDDRTEAERWRCSCHEASHAVVAHMTGGHVHRISIVQSARSGGSTVASLGGANVHSKGALNTLVMAALAGRAGEEVMGLGPSTGAHEDLAQATGIAAAIRASFGLGSSLLHLAPMDRAADLLASNDDLRRAVSRDLDRLYAAARSCVALHRSLVEALARLLMTERIVGAPAFLALVRAHDAALDHQAEVTLGGVHG